MAMNPSDPDVRPTAALSSLFRGLGDPSRLAILRHLALGEHRVVDLTRHLGLAQSTVSKHLSCLRDCGLVTSRASGRASMFRLTQPEAVADVLVAADRLLALTGDAAVRCPTYGPCVPPEDVADLVGADGPHAAAAAVGAVR